MMKPGDHVKIRPGAYFVTQISVPDYALTETWVLSYVGETKVNIIKNASGDRYLCGSLNISDVIPVDKS